MRCPHPPVFAVLLSAAKAAFVGEGCRLSSSPIRRADTRKSRVARSRATVRGLNYHNGCHEPRGVETPDKRLERGRHVSGGVVQTQG
jgi:hypothetical protein